MDSDYNNYNFCIETCYGILYICAVTFEFIPFSVLALLQD